MNSATRMVYLQRMGIAVWQRRHADAEETAARPDVIGPDATAGISEAIPQDWNTLRSAVAACTACELHKTRKQTVFGTGNPQADWMIVGEAPGADEDKQGEPFVGRAGKLLDQMLRAAGFKREEVFIANILKCRPPGNRDPKPEEAAACSGFLRRQIEHVQPKIILCVGRVAAQNLLATDAPTGRLRGQVHTHAETGVPVIVTYHPAYLLRQPAEKRKSWEDLKLALQVMEQTG